MPLPILKQAFSDNGWIELAKRMNLGIAYTNESLATIAYSCAVQLFHQIELRDEHIKTCYEQLGFPQTPDYVAEQISFNKLMESGVPEFVGEPVGNYAMPDVVR